MDSERHKQASEIFLQLCDLPSNERMAAAARECGDDTDLRKIVEDLLHHDRSTNDPPVDVKNETFPHIDQLGPYKILERIGEGGMGIVYLAEQSKPIRRRVALKVIKPGMDSRVVIARFEAERQALALMDHPGVARVFDAGTTDQGRPYFAMEHVAGVPITEHCDRQKLNIEERLNLFIEVCEAVQHAHQKGIIHRDIKPGNILVAFVDGNSVPKVIDFGVAKATEHRLTERTLFTEQGQLIGTPSYMSPEQAEMTAQDVDTRSDIYSLGVLLYELMTGSLPFDPKSLFGAAFEEIRRIIREDEPPKPSTKLSELDSDDDTDSVTVARNRDISPDALTRTLRGDLDWVTMKAIEKNRTRRYASASDFAADIRRHLNDEPVSAGPPSGAYRLSKFLRRNKKAMGVVCALFLALAIGLALSLSFYLQAERQRQRVTLAEAEASKRLKESEAIIEFLTKTLEWADPRESRGRGRTVEAMLDNASKRVSRGFSGQPALEARLRHTLGNTFRGLGAFEKAEAQLRRAVRLRNDELGSDNRYSLHSTVTLARALRGKGELEEAESLARSAMETAQTTLGGENQSTLNAMECLCGVLVLRGKLDEAANLSRKTVGIMQRVLGRRDRRTLDAMNWLGVGLREKNELVEAEQVFTELLGLQRQVLGAKHPYTLWSMSHLAGVLSRQRKSVEAEKLHRRTLELRQEVFGANHPDTLNSEANLSIPLRRLGRLDEAETYARHAVELRQAVMGDDNPEGFWWIEVLVDVLVAQGDLQRARSYLVNVIAARAKLAEEESCGPNNLNRYASLLLTCIPDDLRDPETALSVAKRAAELANRQEPNLLNTLALAYFMTGETDKAVETQEEVISLLAPGKSWMRRSFETNLEKFRTASRAESTGNDFGLSRDSSAADSQIEP